MRRLFLPMLAVLAAAAVARAGTLIDPFVEAFRLGRVEVPAQGAPAELFAPPSWSPTWSGAYARLTSLPRETREGTDAWRAVASARGDTAADAWWNRHVDPDAQLATPDSPRPPRERTAIDAFAALARGDTASALALADSLLDARDLSGEARLTWRLRREELAGPARTDRAPWPELRDLDPCDRALGWRLWRASAAARGIYPLAFGDDPDGWARWLVAAGDDALTGPQLDRAPLNDDLKAAVGAQLLHGSDLRRHFGMYPEPPADRRLQGWWLQGRLRGVRDDGEAAERLSERPGVGAANRATLLRRAADRRAAVGLWGAVLPDLRTAHRLAEISGRRSVLDRVRFEISRLRAVARRRGRGDLVDALGEIWTAPVTRDSDGPRVAAARRLVRAGTAPDVRREPLSDYAGRAADAELAAWRAWTDLARTWDAEDAGRAVAAYVDALGGVREARDLDDAREAAAHAVGPLLEAAGCLEPAATWLLTADAARRADAPPPALPSPLPELVGEAGSGAVPAAWRRHALYGAALLAGDGRGRLAAGVRLPRSKLPEDERIRLLYPVPDSDDLAAVLAGTDDPALVLAVVRNESLFEPGVRSRAGALGYMQIMPFLTPPDPDGEEPGWRRAAVSLRRGAALLDENARREGRDPYRTLAGYNAGPGAVARWDDELGGGAPADVFLAAIGYPETRDYVEKVLIDRQVYDWILRDTPGAQSADDADRSPARRDGP